MGRPWLFAFAFAVSAAVSANALARPVLAKLAFSDMAGWHDYDASASLQAFRRSCGEIIATGHAFQRPVEFGGDRSDWVVVCAAAEHASSPKHYFETHFTPLRISDPVRPEGLFTGYFEPEADGSLAPSPDFPVPVYRKPHDLTAFDDAASAATGLHYGRIVDGAARGYFTRVEIEGGALAGRGLEILWLKSWADAFFIHIQGSGRVRLADGTLVRLAYSAKSGQPYTGIGRLLVDRGVLAEANMSMQAIRAWMADEPDAARALMRENKSYIFFRQVEVDDASRGPPGAQGVNLTPLVSLAVDRGIWMFGTPMWIMTDAPKGEAATLAPFVQLMIAQDTGTAIRGHIRGDVFWGAGPEAAQTAGHMKSPGGMIALLPNALAARLLKAQ